MLEQDFEQLLRQYESTLDDKKKFTALVNDLLSDYDKTVNLLLIAYNMGIAQDIYDTVRIDNAFAFRYVKILIEKFGISRENSEYIVSLWCHCYGEKVLGKVCDISDQNVNAPSTTSLDELENEVKIDNCTYKLYDDGYHMIQVTNNSVAEVNIPQFINGIQVISVGQESILDVNPPGFWECEKLKKVNIPEGVKVVGGFHQCSNLAQIVLPTTVTEIASEAFCWCFKLNNIVFPMGLQKIGSEAFYGCYSLKSIYLPDNVYSLEEMCFAESGLEFVKLPDNLEHLSHSMFMGCENLLEINFPKNLAKGEILSDIFYDDIESPEWKEAYNKIMKSLNVVRVSLQNEEEAKELFGKYGITVQVYQT